MLKFSRCLVGDFAVVAQENADMLAALKLGCQLIGFRESFFKFSDFGEEAFEKILAGGGGMVDESKH